MCNLLKRHYSISCESGISSLVLKQKIFLMLTQPNAFNLMLQTRVQNMVIP